MKLLWLAAFAGILLTPASYGQSIACPATVRVSDSGGSPSTAAEGKDLPLDNAYVLVSRFGNELSRDIPSISEELKRKGIIAYYELPIDPDVVVFRCDYFQHGLGVTVTLNVPHAARYCWVRAKKSTKVQIDSVSEARCDAALPVQ